jgi:hypothetical protein
MLFRILDLVWIAKIMVSKLCNVYCGLDGEC